MPGSSWSLSLSLPSVVEVEIVSASASTNSEFTSLGMSPALQSKASSVGSGKNSERENVIALRRSQGNLIFIFKDSEILIVSYKQ